MTRIIGLCGPAGAGKTTTAAYLARVYGAKVYAFATPLKAIVGKAFDLSHTQLYGTQADKEATDERYNVSPRWLMQHVGTEGIRAVLGSTFWAELIMADIKRDSPRLAVIEDVRFESEATRVRFHTRIQYSARSTIPVHQQDGFVWRVENPWQEITADPGHPSESEWTLCPYDRALKPSEKSLPALYREVDAACKATGIHPHIFDAESL